MLTPCTLQPQQAPFVCATSLQTFYSFLRCWHDANHFLVVSTHLYTALEYCGCMQGIPYICYSELYVFTDIYKNFTFHDMSSRVLLRGLNNFRRVKSLLSITENALDVLAFICVIKHWTCLVLNILKLHFY